MKLSRHSFFSPLSAESVVRLAIILVFIISILALIGWMLGIDILKSISPHFTAMKVVTALCFLLSAAALACIQGKSTKRWQITLSRLFAAPVSTIGLLTAICYLVEVQTGQECHWASSPFLNFLYVPADRMAIITAILFSFFGFVLLLLGVRSKRAADISHAFLLPLIMLTYLVLVGYLLNVRVFYEWLHVGVALNTAIAFSFLCIASFCIRPESWLMKVFTGMEAGAIMARRLLPSLLIIPPVIGWLRIQGERTGIFGSEVGVSLVAVTYAICFFWLVWFNARSVNRTDQIRRQAEDALRQTTEELARSNKDLEQFAYIASHDLQEPLRAVAGFIGILKKKYENKLDADAREYIDQSVDGAERMKVLINDLLTYSRVVTKGEALKLISMKTAFDAAINNLQTAIGESKSVITHDSLPAIIADTSQMTQLLQNLIGNAIKFRGLGLPEIHVIARHDGQHWVFGVRDNGIGIEPQYLERIFLIFQRLHTRNQYPGTGIGLALCKKIVERHAGSIWVESAPGCGSTFYFTIPAKGDNK